MDEKITEIKSIQRYKFAPSTILKSPLYIKFITWALFIMLCAEFGLIIYLNFAQNGSHIGYDASSSMLVPIEICKENSIFLKHYSVSVAGLQHTLVALVFSATNNIFLSFAVVNVLSSFILLILIWKICKSFELPKLNKLIVAVLIFMPLVTSEYNDANPLEYFSNMFFSAAFYSWKSIAGLTALAVYLDCTEGKKTFGTFALKIFSIIQFAWAGLQSDTTYIIFFISPCIISTFFSAIYGKEKGRTLRAIIWMAVHVGCFATGNIIARNFTEGVSFAGGGMQTVILGNLFDNTVNVFLGFGKLLGIMPVYYGETVLSFNGIIYLIKTLFYFVMLAIIVHIIYKISRGSIEKSSRNIVLASFAVVNFVLYFFVNSTYGMPVFEDRYLILFWLVLCIAIGVYLMQFADGSIWKSIFSFFTLVIAFVITLSSYHYINRQKTDFYTYIKPILYKYDQEIVYMFNEPICRNLRVVDETKVYKWLYTDENGSFYVIHWGDYIYYDDITDEISGSLLICTEDEFNTYSVNGSLSSYVYVDSVEYEDIKFNIYSSESAIDLRSGLPLEDISYDYPTSPGVCLTNYDVIDGKCTTNGAEGYSMFGPYSPTLSGKYAFTLNYDVIESIGNEAGAFEIAIDMGSKILNSEIVYKNENEITLIVDLEEGHSLEYRFWTYSGTKATINFIRMEKLSDEINDDAHLKE